MKRYYNHTTHEWYTEGQSLTRNIPNGVFSGIPSVEQLTEWGYEEWVIPVPTSLNAASKVYVDDMMVAAYKASSAWSATQGRIYPISEYVA